MHQSENNASPVVSYLIEHSHGTCELWIRADDSGEIKVYEPLKLVPVSGKGTLLLRPEMIAEAIMLEDWMADHFCVFRDGRTSFD